MTNFSSFTNVSTHQHVDADAAFSAALLHVLFGHSVSFCSSAIKAEEHEPSTVYVDVSSGIKGERSAFETLVSMIGLGGRGIERLAEEVSMIDTKSGPKQTFGLSQVIAAFRREKGDAATVAFAADVIRGVLSEQKERDESHVAANAATIVGRVAILRDAPMGAKGILFDRGVDVAIMSDAVGVAIVRADRVTASLDAPCVRAVVEQEDGWFFHPKGFLASRGTFKSPAKTPSGVDLVKLAEAVNAIL